MELGRLKSMYFETIRNRLLRGKIKEKKRCFGICCGWNVSSFVVYSSEACPSEESKNWIAKLATEHAKMAEESALRKAMISQCDTPPAEHFGVGVLMKASSSRFYMPLASP